jgi:hypothetical protein
VTESASPKRRIRLRSAGLSNPAIASLSIHSIPLPSNGACLRMGRKLFSFTRQFQSEERSYYSGLDVKNVPELYYAGAWTRSRRISHTYPPNAENSTLTPKKPSSQPVSFFDLVFNTCVPPQESNQERVSLSQHVSPRRASIPSLTMIGTITSPATGSAHHQPHNALSRSPPSRMAER